MLRKSVVLRVPNGVNVTLETDRDMGFVYLTWRDEANTWRVCLTKEETSQLADELIDAATPLKEEI